MVIEKPVKTINSLTRKMIYNNIDLRKDKCYLKTRSHCMAPDFSVLGLTAMCWIIAIGSAVYTTDEMTDFGNFFLYLFHIE